MFSLVSMGQIRRGKVDRVLLQLAAVAVAPSFVEGAPTATIGALFEISVADFKALCKREQRYKIVQLECFACVDGEAVGQPVTAYVVTESTDTAYTNKCVALDAAEGLEAGCTYQQNVGQYYDGELWSRKDIFPSSPYLWFCIEAAKCIGGSQAHKNFLDGSFLADRRTSIRTVSEMVCAWVIV